MISKSWRHFLGLISVAWFSGTSALNAQTPSAGRPLDFSAFPQNIRANGREHGEAAINALGNRLPEVAAFYEKTPDQLQKLFRADHCLRLDRDGRLFYICDVPPIPEETVAATNIGPTDAAPFSTEQTFRLHSRKGAGRVIYLCFVGYDASASSWGTSAIGRPFDLDGDPYTFNATERDRIVYIWQRVAEDFAMFNIDVTTEDPGDAGLIKSNTGDTNFGIRAVIAGAWTDWFNSSAGGVAYLNSFGNTSLNPCWIFPKNLDDNEKNIAEATSHEVGHTLGLNHDGRTSPVEGYYTGQGNWAPIMGVGYYEPIVQWSKGEYANANNTEDDFAVMLTKGALYRADDHGDTTGSATALAGVSFATNGIISQRTDLDFFRFTTGAGRVNLTVNRAPRDSNLRIQAVLYDTNGVVLQTTNVADTTSGTQLVNLTATLAAGTYFLSVDGIGADDPLTTGYSDYASLGQYSIIGKLPADSAWLPTVAAIYDWTNTVNWASNTLPNGVGAVLRVNNNIVGDQVINVSTPVTLGNLFLGDNNTTHGFTIQPAGGTFDFRSLSPPAALSKISGVDDFISVPLQLSDDLVVTNSASSQLSLTGGITGSGSLTKAGAGQLNLGGAISNSGGVIVNAGRLVLNGGATLSGPVEVKAGGQFDVSALGGWTLNSGQSLAGSGAIMGDVAAGSGATVAPGSSGIAGTLTFSNHLALNGGANLRFDLAASTTPGGGTNDLLVVNGNLTLSGTITLNPNFLAAFPASPGDYTIIRYTGALTGGATNFASLNYSNRFVLTFDDTTPGEIHLLVSGTPANLVWRGDAANRWNFSAPTNWFDGTALGPFQNLDSVTFDDTGSVAPAVTLTNALTPFAVTVNSVSNYTFTGAGKISGVTGLTKSGAGMLTLSNNNDFTGAVTVSGGTLRIGNAAALGATNSGLTISSGAQLDVNAFSLGTENITVSGAGIGSNGAIVNNSATAQNFALRFVNLAADTTFGGNGRWDIRANPTATLAGNNFALTKTGANSVWLVDLGATGLGDINVNQGTLGIQDSTTLGSAAATLTLQPGATLGLFNTDVNPLNKNFVMNGGTLNSDVGVNLIRGTMALSNSITITAASALMMQAGISGAGGFTKNGAGTLVLAAPNTFAGAVTVAVGTLRCGTNSSVGSTNATLTIASDARLDVGGFSLGAKPVTVTGDGLGIGGAIVNSGASQQNALRFVTLSGNTTFGGINRWDIRANPTGALTGNNRTLTKRGPNEIWLVDLGATDLGNISIAQGMLGIQGTTTLGSAVSNLTVSANTSLGLWATGPNNPLLKAMTLSGGRLYNGTGTNFFNGNCTMTGSNSFDLASGSILEMGGVLSSSGSLWAFTGGTLILSGNNTYSGATVINAGILQIGNGGGAGTPGTATITNNAMLVFHRTNDFTVGNVIAGTGSLTKRGSGVLTLTASSTFTGNVTNNELNAGILRLRHSAALGLGPKVINLRSGGSPNTSGSFGIEVENNLTLDTNFSWRISNDGAGNAPNIPALRSRSGVNTIAGSLLLQNGGGHTRIANDAGATLNLTGSVTTDVAGGRELILDGAGTAGNFSGVISNGTAATMFVSVAKEGAGTWTFSGTNFSDGAAFVRAGTLVLSGITGTNFLVVSNGATLSGTGLIRGIATVNGTLSPGPANAIGTLFCSNQLVLNGSALMQIIKSPALTNDQVRGLTICQYGGTLLVTNLAGALAQGDTFRLFSAAAYTGTFSSITLPTLTPPLIWSNRLTLDGSLLVARVAVVTPVVSGPVLTGTNFNFQFATQAGIAYVLQQADTLAPPAWTSVSTNIGDGNPMIFNLPVDVWQSSRYYRIAAF